VVGPLHAVEVEIATPPGGVLAPDLSTHADFPIHQLAGAGGDRQCFGRVGAAVIAAVHDHRRVIGHAHDQRNVGCRQVDANGVVIDPVQPAGAQRLGFRIDQAAHARGHRVALGSGVTPAGDVVDHVIGIQLVAVRPFHALAHVQGIGRGVVACLPALQQPALEAEIVVPAHQVLVALAGDIGHLGPVEGARVFPRLHRHRNPHDAALLGRCGRRRGRYDTAQRESARRCHAEGRHCCQVFSAVELARLEIFCHRLCHWVQRAICHHHLGHLYLPAPALCQGIIVVAWPPKHGEPVWPRANLLSGGEYHRQFSCA
jgi:hypothetical protein